MDKEAKEALGRTPENIVAIRPMKDGAIANFMEIVRPVMSPSRRSLPIQVVQTNCGTNRTNVPRG